ncbi:hypothetical protein N9L33_05735 [Nitrospinae bacterium]|nr:hypothetical protein [Nitrospinota bacterium]
MNEATEQIPPESLNNEIVEDRKKIFEPQNELPFPESEVDLNEVFPGEESDLNDLFPDEETKLLLKKIQRNKKDLHTMTDRFVDDNWGGIENEETANKEPTKPQEVTDNS